MKIIDPRVDPALVPAGSRAIVVGAGQNEYQDLPSIRTGNCQVITRYELTDDERLAVSRGEDIYVTILTCGAVQPLKVTVGPIDWRPCPMCNAPEGDDCDYRCPFHDKPR